jgi:hypothetical protein
MLRCRCRYFGKLQGSRQIGLIPGLTISIGQCPREIAAQHWGEFILLGLWPGEWALEYLDCLVQIAAPAGKTESFSKPISEGGLIADLE